MAGQTRILASWPRILCLGVFFSPFFSFPLLFLSFLSFLSGSTTTGRRLTLLTVRLIISLIIRSARPALEPYADWSPGKGFCLIMYPLDIADKGVRAAALGGRWGACVPDGVAVKAVPAGGGRG